MNESWEHALALYDSLSGENWSYIPPFRALVEVLAQSKEAAGLTAVTSQATLILSPYTTYPDDSVVDRRTVTRRRRPQAVEADGRALSRPAASLLSPVVEYHGLACLLLLPSCVSG